MKAILLAAGLGTRLRPLTLHTPKCLVMIKGKPLLDTWLERLQNVDISPVLVNTHYLRDEVRKYIENSKYTKNVILIHEPILLGTAGTLIQNLAFFGTKFLFPDDRLSIIVTSCPRSNKLLAVQLPI